MVARSDIDSMANLIAIMNGSSTSAASKPDGLKAKASKGVDDIAAMKTILERFNQAGTVNSFSTGVDHATVALVEDSTRDRTLRNAMQTQQTEDGVMVGMWEIRGKTGSGRKLYDVVKAGETSPIAVDLTLYEAALGLAYAMDDGLPITSKPVRALLIAEEEFANAVHDAIHAKMTLKRQTLNESRRAMVEDKYGAAVRRADGARGRVRALVAEYRG